jgi:endonuclease/exonuclease/phosphatase family metal-dependent hydrolase
MRRFKRLGRRAIRISAWAAATVFALRVLPGATAEPSPEASIPGASAFRMVTYNILGTDPDPDGRLTDALVARAPAVVGLVEVPESRAEALAADPALAELYPYQEFRPHAPHGGIAILSSYPMETTPNDPSVPVLQAFVDVDGTRVAIIEAHATNPLSSSGRDAELGRIRELIEELKDAGYPVVMAGDLNTNDFEPAFWSLSEGLRHVDTGATWGPSPDGPALLRIDHILTTPDLAPTDGVADCDASASDHCLLETVIAVPAADSLPSPQGIGDPPLLVVADAA